MGKLGNWEAVRERHDRKEIDSKVECDQNQAKKDSSIAHGAINCLLHEGIDVVHEFTKVRGNAGYVPSKTEVNLVVFSAANFQADSCSVSIGMRYDILKMDSAVVFRIGICGHTG